MTEHRPVVDPLLQELHDENEIRKLVVGFSLGMDARDVALFRSAWADEIELDLESRAGDVIGLSGTRRADDYAADVIALLSGFTATQHVSSNHLIDVRGDDATCACYTLATHLLAAPGGDRWLTAGSRYDLVARRFSEVGWRFTRFSLRSLWSSGDGAIWQAVAEGIDDRR